MIPDEQTRQKWAPRLALAGGALVIAALALPLGGKAPQGQALLAHSPVLGGVLALAALAGAFWGLRRRPWGLAVAGLFLFIMGRVVFGEFYLGRPTADPGYHISPFKVPAYYLFILGLLGFAASFVFLMFRRLAEKMAAKAQAAGDAPPPPPGETAPKAEGQPGWKSGPMDGQLLGAWRVVDTGGQGGPTSSSSFLNATYEFRPDGKLKVGMWGLSRKARYRREGRNMQVRLRGHWPGQKWTILSLSGNELVVRNEYRGGMTMRLERI